ncbi:hypothetical protein AAMO2058_001716600 [Amorphochlora amoebiformis]
MMLRVGSLQRRGYSWQQRAKSRRFMSRLTAVRDECMTFRGFQTLQSRTRIGDMLQASQRTTRTGHPVPSMNLTTMPTSTYIPTSMTILSVSTTSDRHTATGRSSDRSTVRVTNRGTVHGITTASIGARISNDVNCIPSDTRSRTLSGVLCRVPFSIQTRMASTSATSQAHAHVQHDREQTDTEPNTQRHFQPVVPSLKTPEFATPERTKYTTNYTHYTPSQLPPSKVLIRPKLVGYRRAKTLLQKLHVLDSYVETSLVYFKNVPASKSTVLSEIEQLFGEYISKLSVRLEKEVNSRYVDITGTIQGGPFKEKEAYDLAISTLRRMLTTHEEMMPSSNRKPKQLMHVTMMKLNYVRGDLESALKQIGDIFNDLGGADEKWEIWKTKCFSLALIIAANHRRLDVIELYFAKTQFRHFDDALLPLYFKTIADMPPGLPGEPNEWLKHTEEVLRRMIIAKDFKPPYSFYAKLCRMCHTPDQVMFWISEMIADGWTPGYEIALHELNVRLHTNDQNACIIGVENFIQSCENDRSANPREYASVLSALMANNSLSPVPRIRLFEFYARKCGISTMESVRRYIDARLATQGFDETRLWILSAKRKTVFAKSSPLFEIYAMLHVIDVLWERPKQNYAKILDLLKPAAHRFEDYIAGLGEEAPEGGSEGDNVHDSKLVTTIAALLLIEHLQTAEHAKRFRLENPPPHPRPVSRSAREEIHSKVRAYKNAIDIKDSKYHNLVTEPISEPNLAPKPKVSHREPNQSSEYESLLEVDSKSPGAARLKFWVEFVEYLSSHQIREREALIGQAVSTIQSLLKRRLRWKDDSMHRGLADYRLCALVCVNSADVSAKLADFEQAWRWIRAAARLTGEGMYLVSGRMNRKEKFEEKQLLIQEFDYLSDLDQKRRLNSIQDCIRIAEEDLRITDKSERRQHRHSKGFSPIVQVMQVFESLATKMEQASQQPAQQSLPWERVISMMESWRLELVSGKHPMGLQLMTKLLTRLPKDCYYSGLSSLAWFVVPKNTDVKLTNPRLIMECALIAIGDTMKNSQHPAVSKDEAFNYWIAHVEPGTIDSLPKNEFHRFLGKEMSTKWFTFEKALLACERMENKNTLKNTVRELLTAYVSIIETHNLSPKMARFMISCAKVTGPDEKKLRMDIPLGGHAEALIDHLLERNLDFDILSSVASKAWKDLNSNLSIAHVVRILECLDETEDTFKFRTTKKKAEFVKECGIGLGNHKIVSHFLNQLSPANYLKLLRGESKGLLTQLLEQDKAGTGISLRLLHAEMRRKPSYQSSLIFKSCFENTKELLVTDRLWIILRHSFFAGDLDEAKTALLRLSGIDVSAQAKRIAGTNSLRTRGSHAGCHSARARWNDKAVLFEAAEGIAGVDTCNDNAKVFEIARATLICNDADFREVLEKPITTRQSR